VVHRLEGPARPLRHGRGPQPPHEGVFLRRPRPPRLRGPRASPPVVLPHLRPRHGVVRLPWTAPPHGLDDVPRTWLAPLDRGDPLPAGLVAYRVAALPVGQRQPPGRPRPRSQGDLPTQPGGPLGRRPDTQLPRVTHFGFPAPGSRNSPVTPTSCL